MEVRGEVGGDEEALPVGCQLRIVPPDTGVQGRAVEQDGQAKEGVQLGVQDAVHEVVVVILKIQANKVQTPLKV